MEIRIFQIVVPLIALLFTLRQVMKYRQGKNTLFEVGIVSLFWLVTTALALFPDSILDTIAKAFGIKSNVNTLLFFAIGLLFYLHFQIYKILKKQDGMITELTRKLALESPENEPDEA
jgi:hypothetical protein